LRVLIVDDNEPIRGLMASLCRSEGCEADEAEDGDVGSLLFEQAEHEGRPYALVILDLAMPAVDGGTAAKRMRAAEGRRGCWIEGFTGYQEHVTQARTFLDAGIDHLTVKPGDPEGWRRLIRSLVVK
jgi:CheY-like chemotaxis protein